MSHGAADLPEEPDPMSRGRHRLVFFLVCVVIVGVVTALLRSVLP